MKLIPCPKCGVTAIGPTSDRYPNGAPVVFGRFTGGRDPVVVKCFRCKGSFKLDAQAFSRIPVAGAVELKDWGLG